MKRIEIAYPGGPIVIEAHVSGKFAVHAPEGQPAKDWKPSGWYRVSHVATGRAVVEIQRLRVAKQIVKELNALLPDFDIGPAEWEPEWSERYRAFVAAAHKVIQDKRTA